MAEIDFDAIRAAVRATGLVVRGAFLCTAQDGVPPVDGIPAACMVLIGSVGAHGFAAFRDSPWWGREPDPLESFTEHALDGLARTLGAAVLYPHRGPPWLPFQRWAMRAGPARASPLGLLVHPQHGLWHAYRGALTFARPVAGVRPARRAARPCDSCTGRPCLSACPVGAFDGTGYDVAACAAHLATPDGWHCLQAGCAARGACPVAPHARYGGEQVQFHMRAFARARGVG